MTFLVLWFYFADIILFICMLSLCLKGQIPISGTGSGSLSHSIIRTIAPTGHLYTFEFHEQRAKIAEQEFKDHKISQYVTVKQRDVCAKGFDLDHVADAVFLDLPTPWEAVRSAKQALKLEGDYTFFFLNIEEQLILIRG